MKNAIAMPTWLTTCIANHYASEDWLRDLQQEIGQAFLQRGLPSRHEELWKYTDVSFLQDEILAKATVKKSTELPTSVAAKQLKDIDSITVTLVNGHFVETLSDLNLLPAGVILCSLKHALQHHAVLVQAHLATNLNMATHPFASLNAALVADGVFLHIPKNTNIVTPIHIHYLNSDDNHFVMCPRNMIIIGENSKCIILEEHTAEAAEQYFMNVVTDIHAAKAAHIDYHKIQNDSHKATHIAQIYINQSQDSCVNAHSLLVGSRLGREDVFVNLHATGAEISVNGFYCLTQDSQHIDNHIHIDHRAPLGTSDMVYKGMLDKKSRAVFNGKIYVHKDAQKTRSYQANHNILLSTDAEVDTKPEFEIYADDVKCAHGDTVGQMDLDALFYLQARGIAKVDAQKLLNFAFAADVMNKVNLPQIKQRMIDLLSETLAYDN